MRPTPAGLTIDPRIPPEWGRVRVNLRFRDRRVHVTATPDRFEVAVDGRVPLVVDGAVVEAEGTRAWSRVDDRWRAE